eukprot:NODE_12975_length_267_cov_46.637615_g12062_i0.p3 GENE.NODE_12975_length_267_cov_46.637615_g12062_i0~~NODE_12975_length_267_cov_46.637615_g12062_i0.p3  ORF type:complete len:63 (+),score=22.39 NODE_12975_length_267_cov_46.637615_g12062_i0:33-191(+)
MKQYIDPELDQTSKLSKKDMDTSAWNGFAAPPKAQPKRVIPKEAHKGPCSVM